MPDERDNVTATAPPETPPPIITRTENSDGRNWIMLIVYLLIALVVAALVVLAGRWLYSTLADDEPAQEATITTERQNEQPAANQPAAAPPAPANQPPPAPTPAPTPPPARSGQIADTGSGEVIAIFITAATVAAGLHYLYQLRKSSNY